MGAIGFHNLENGIPSNAPLLDLAKYATLFGGAVINATWSPFQPAAAAPLTAARSSNRYAVELSANRI